MAIWTHTQPQCRFAQVREGPGWFTREMLSHGCTGCMRLRGASQLVSLTLQPACACRITWFQSNQSNQSNPRLQVAVSRFFAAGGFTV